ncbi:MAG: DNA (cytosine-5-)-methyltransferase [Pyrinomonadaceae bacterium]|nr:DNA (cytosine-5-)-methyltransferase [Pyrinomonadaceae bacterium]
MARGWTVLRFWESDVKNNLDFCVETTLRVIGKKAGTFSRSLLPQRSFAEFFAGIGLVRMGLENQGWIARFANEIDDQKKNMYCGHFGQTIELVVRDIRDVTTDQIPAVTLATASFPCNDLSLAGGRAGLNGGSSSVFWDFMRILKDSGNRRPPIVLLENVTGFLSSNGGLDFRDALAALSRLGYSVDSFILDAVDFVPHSRKRLFVIGVLDRVRSPIADQPRNVECAESTIRPKRLIQFINSNKDIRWNIRPLPDPPRRETMLWDILEDLPLNAPEWWSKKRARYLLSQMSPRHRAVADKMIAGRRWSYGTVFRRMRKYRSTAELRIDGIAGCLRTPRGGSARQILFKAGRGKYYARLLTPGDAAQLMGAKDFRISVSRNQALFGFGDAVCVPVVEWIATYYLNPLVNELIRSSPLGPTA